MSASTPIASLVQSMLADGVEHAAIIRAVQAAEALLRQRASSPGSVRGTRLPSDWRPSEDLVAYAVEQGMPANRIQLEAEKLVKSLQVHGRRTGGSLIRGFFFCCQRFWAFKRNQRSQKPSHFKGRRRGTPSKRAIYFPDPPVGRSKVWRLSIADRWARHANYFAKFRKHFFWWPQRQARKIVAKFRWGGVGR